MTKEELRECILELDVDSGDLEKAFSVAAEESDCSWKEDIKKKIKKR